MKRLLPVILAMALLSCALLCTACDSSSGSQNSDETDENRVVRYDLVDVEFTNISVDAYEYNYIEFDFENGTYVLKNKVKSNGVITEQRGDYTIDNDGYVTITNDDVPSQNYFLYAGEEAYFNDRQKTTLRVELYISDYGYVYMEFAK